jgi:hypothetical protein
MTSPLECIGSRFVAAWSLLDMDSDGAVTVEETALFRQYLAGRRGPQADKRGDSARLASTD